MVVSMVAVWGRALVMVVSFGRTKESAVVSVVSFGRTKESAVVSVVSLGDRELTGSGTAVPRPMMAAVVHAVRS